MVVPSKTGLGNEQISLFHSIIEYHTIRLDRSDMDTGRMTPAAATPPLTQATTATGRWVWPARLMWLVLTGLVLLTLSQIWPENYSVTYGEWVVTQTRPAVQTLMRYGDFVRIITVLESLSALTALLMGFMIFWYKSNDKMGLFVSAFLILTSPWFLSANMETWQMPSWMPFSSTLISLLMSANLSSLVLFFYLFPDGHFVPSWTRWPVILLLVVFGIYILGSLFNIPAPFANIWFLYAVFFLGSLFVAGIAQFYRYRTLTDPLQRQQMKWVVWGFGAYIIGAALTFAGVFWGPFFWGPVLELLVWTTAKWFIPLAIGFSILRYRLWDIDLLINRTLVYGMLTAFVIGLYVSLVGALGSFFQQEGNPLIAALATGVVALLFEPLRRRLQRSVNRLMYGEQDDPVALLNKLGTRLEQMASPETTLVSFVETLAHSLKLPYVAIGSETAGNEAEPWAVYGLPATDSMALPLSYQGEKVGQLWVGLRSKGETFSHREQQLLETVAQQLGTAVHALRLTSDLQQSRERLVAAREEERLRIRRDLHDGLGPQLASLALKLDAARNLLKQDVQKVEPLLVELKEQAQTAVTDIRELVYGLRPPTLDQLGLVSALQEFAAAHSQNGLHITVMASQPLPNLSAAAEVAAYRIAIEAMTNVVRHAGATHCQVHLTLDKALNLEISDNGCSFVSGQKFGVGLTSMQERARELGGTLTIEARPEGGTIVRAQLPLHDKADTT